MSKIALIAGATGLIGSNLLSLLLVDDTYEVVNSISRRTSGIQHKKLNETICSFDKMDDFADRIKGNDVFICLGSTLNRAGSKEAFKRIDYTYPLRFAEIALNNGAKQISFVSALGANNSSWFFYNRVKGELEQAISELQYDTINILRPSLLLGDREETRIVENIAANFYNALGWAFIGPIKKYKAIDSKKVALAMNKIARSSTSGIKIFNSNEITAIM